MEFSLWPMLKLFLHAIAWTCSVVASFPLPQFPVVKSHVPVGQVDVEESEILDGFILLAVVLYLHGHPVCLLHSSSEIA